MAKVKNNSVANFIEELGWLLKNYYDPNFPSEVSKFASSCRVLVSNSQEDLPALSSLYQQLLPNESSVEKMKVALQTIKQNPNQVVLGAYIDGRLVGSVQGVSCQMLFGQCKTFMIIEDVVVDANYRRLGIGQALFNALESFAAERNCSYCMLITDAKRDKAIRFYHSIGYQTEPYRGFKKLF